MESREIRRIIEAHEKNKVVFYGTDGVVISPEAVLESGVIIYPGTIIEGPTVIGEGCILGPNALISDCRIGKGCRINASQCYHSSFGEGCHVGPFAHVRPDCTVGDNVKLGAFVEIKNSVIGDGTSLAHLCYVGDADVGKRVNFGCGVVVVNYDGKQKHRTTVEDDAFIGCNTNLIAPVAVRAGAYIAAASNVTDEVPADALAIGRSRLEIKPDRAHDYRKPR